jgi:hypothetical protein
MGNPQSIKHFILLVLSQIVNEAGPLIEEETLEKKRRRKRSLSYFNGSDSPRG